MPCSPHISSVWPNGLFGAWMMTWGWSCVSGPLWTPTRQPPPLFSDGHGRRSSRGGVTAPGTTPTHVLLLRIRAVLADEDRVRQPVADVGDRVLELR